MYICGMDMTNETQKIIVNVVADVFVELIINEKRDGYTFKTPKAWGGRHYYSFCNYVQWAFQEQFPELEYEIRMNERNNY